MTDNLTNAHTHLELTDLAHLCPREPMPFPQWLIRLAWQSRARTRADILASVEQGIALLEACGTTCVGDVTTTPGLRPGSEDWYSVEPLLASHLRGVVYLEVLGLRRTGALERLERAKQQIVAARRRLREDRVRLGLSLHAPYSCHPDLLRAGARWCAEYEVPLCIHVAESPAESDLLLHGRLPVGQAARAGPVVRWAGQLLAVLARFALPPIPHLRPIPYLESLGVLEARPLLVHAIHVTQSDVDVIARSGAAVVHCPRSNHYLKCGRMPLERYLAAGIPVYLGTDSLASSPSLDVRDEASFARQLHGNLVASERIAEMLHMPLA